ncbi:hypothetical protein [Streptomyces sp. NPDC003720]|uniref:hypothetical protein n=1 Tax=Streptomyces sp. NPDC003720 TaxID=3364684 RepID=UPI00369D747D
MTYVITSAQPDDAASIGPLHLRNWLQNYTDVDAGIEESWIREHRGSSATAEGIIQWREFIEVANQNPAPHFCRVVRVRGGDRRLSHPGHGPADTSGRE